jgi:hypothetical protein
LPVWQHSDVFHDTVGRWLSDPESAVVHVEEVDGRWAVRMRQEVRDATTVWWTIGERSIRAEAYVLPAPVADVTEAFRQCLVRNSTTWRVRFALDREGAIVIQGRLAAEWVTDLELDLLLGEIYDLIEVSFPALVRAGFIREKKS